MDDKTRDNDKNGIKSDLISEPSMKITADLGQPQKEKNILPDLFSKPLMKVTANFDQPKNVQNVSSEISAAIKKAEPLNVNYTISKLESEFSKNAYKISNGMKTVHQISEVVVKSAEKMESALKSFSEVLSALFKMADFSMTISQLGENLKKVMILGFDVEAKNILIVYEIITKDSLQPQIAEKIIKIYKSSLQDEKKKHKVENIMCSIYSNEKITEILSKWEKQPHLTKRIPILRGCIESYLYQNYYTCIPTIIAQTEGMIAECFRYRGQMREKRYRELISTACETVSTNPYNKLLEEYIFNTLLVSFEHGEAITSTLSRHAILHGADVEYGTQINALRAILMFDFLQSRFSYVSLKNSKTYHKFNCYKIKKLSDVQYFNSREKAVQDGKTPCKICCKEDY